MTSHQKSGTADVMFKMYKCWNQLINTGVTLRKKKYFDKKVYKTVQLGDWTKINQNYNVGF